jgi:MFS transporter, ACS family, D-galactonate transporter
MIGPIPEVSNSRHWTIAGLLFASGFINYLDRAIISVALPLIALDLRLGPAAKGVLLSAFFWSYAIMQLPMGWCADRLNLRWLYAGAFALWSLACGFTGFAGTLGVLIVLRMILGIGESVYLPGGMKIVSAFFDPEHRGLASGLVNCGTRAGLALGAPLIAWLVVKFGWKNAFFIVGFASLIWLVPWLLLFPRGAGAFPCQPRLSTGVTPKGLLHQGQFDRNLLALCLGQICYSYYWYLLVTWLPDYLVESRHMPIQKAGGYALIPYLVFAISEPLGGWIADFLVRLGWSESRSRKTVITVSFLTSLMLLPAGLMANDIQAVALLGGASLVGLATGNILALLQRAAPAGQVGLWTGVLNFAGNLSGIVAPLATGFLIARTGSYYPGFVVAVVILLAGMPVYWWMVGDKREPAAQERDYAHEYK